MNAWQELAAAAEERFGSRLGDNDRGFLSRVFATPAEVYLERLAAVGLEGREEVLDAGCGFGQWSLVLARRNRRVVAVDADPTRLEVLDFCRRRLGLDNLEIIEAGLEELPVEAERCDGVFCYGVIFCTAWHRSLAELARVLEPGGVLYLTANGLGWSVHLWRQRPNPATDYDPRRIAARNLQNTLDYELKGSAPGEGQIIIEPEEMVAGLEGLGLDVVALGGEGTLVVDGADATPTPFFAASYDGLTGVYEVLARKLEGMPK